MSTSKRELCRNPLTVSAQKREPLTSEPATRGFVAMVPRMLREVITDWQPEWPETLKDFPRNILFANYGELRGVLYEPDFSTFSENADTSTLTYRTVVPSDFTVTVMVTKSSGTVQTHKYKGGELIRLASGHNLKGAMMMTTMHGIERNEPAVVGPRPRRNPEELRSCIADHWPPPPERRVREPLVFGVLRKGHGDNNLIFIPQRQAFRLAAIHTAISKAPSWKSFCDRMPLDDLWEVASELRERHKMPTETDDFDDRWLPWGYHDGDWPGWPEQLMWDCWLPREICAEYGKLENSVFNGMFLIFDVRRVRKILNALKDAGFQCLNAPKLVRRACGYWIRSEQR
jgi:hypothetical protein